MCKVTAMSANKDMRIATKRDRLLDKVAFTVSVSVSVFVRTM